MRSARHVGLTRNSGPNELAREALQAVGYQTADLLEAMRSDWPGLESGSTLRVDGGMTASDDTMQFLADITGTTVDRPTVHETTALGAAWLAGHKAGIYPSQAKFAKNCSKDQRFEPKMPTDIRYKLTSGWKDSVLRTLVG